MVWKWWVIGVVILVLSACGEEDREKPWWEVDPLNPPVEIVPPEWNYRCTAIDHPDLSHPSCVRPDDGYGGTEDACVSKRDDFYCNACSEDQWDGCAPCIWLGFAEEVNDQCVSTWLCAAEERMPEFTDMPWEEVKHEACSRLNSPGRTR